MLILQRRVVNNCNQVSEAGRLIAGAEIFSMYIYPLTLITKDSILCLLKARKDIDILCEL